MDLFFSFYLSYVKTDIVWKKYISCKIESLKRPEEELKGRTGYHRIGFDYRKLPYNVTDYVLHEKVLNLNEYNKGEEC